MPKATFLNLPNAKQLKLLAAAKKEFSRVLYADVSINKIIKDADISRGSFYMYFDDKDDLYFYMLKDHKNKLIDILVFLADKNNGNLMEIFKELFDVVLDFCRKDENEQFFRNVFLNMNFYVERNVYKHNLDDNCHAKLKEFMEKLDTELLSDAAKDNLNDAIGQLFHIVIQGVIPIFIFDIDKDKAREHYLRHLNLIERGICK